MLVLSLQPAVDIWAGSRVYPAVLSQNIQGDGYIPCAFAIYVL